MINKKNYIITSLILLIGAILTAFIYFQKNEGENPDMKNRNYENYVLQNTEKVKANYQWRQMNNKKYAFSDELGIGIRLYEVKQTNETNKTNAVTLPKGWTTEDYNVAHSLYVNGVFKYLELDKLDKKLTTLSEFTKFDTRKFDTQISGDVQKDINKYLFNSNFLAINTWFSIEKLTAEQQQKLLLILTMQQAERDKELQALITETLNITMLSSAHTQYPIVAYNDNKIHQHGGLNENNFQISVYYQDDDQSFPVEKKQYQKSIEVLFEHVERLTQEKNVQIDIKFQPIHY